jgi:hypothetical protein
VSRRIQAFVPKLKEVKRKLHNELHNLNEMAGRVVCMGEMINAHRSYSDNQKEDLT